MLNVLSLFSGIGAFEKALANNGVNYNLVSFCEIDKYAARSYCAVHGVPESLNLQDVAKVKRETVAERVDLITYGFPCQDISTAGKKKGFADENGNATRSGLFFEALRIIEEIRPKFAIAENVKALTGKKFTKEFETVLTSLENAGYTNFWKVLNAKDFGVPQNRERVFIVSIRNDICRGFEFPEGFPLAIRLRDVLDEDVDEKYYLSEEKAGAITSACDYKGPKAVNSDVCRTVRAGGRGSADRHAWDLVAENTRIRKLTPRECWRLMGFNDDDYDKAAAVNSGTQLYRQAGNSIVVPVMGAVFRNLGERYEEFAAEDTEAEAVE